MGVPTGAARAPHTTLRAPTIELILFDVGGVLVDLSGVQDMLGWLGGQLTLEQLWRVWLGSPAVRSFETGRSDAQQFARDILRELQLSMAPEQFLRSFAGWPRCAYPGALQLLGSIAPPYRTALLSNSNVLHWPRIIKEMGFGAATPLQFASHLMGRIKPDADCFDYVLQAVALRAEQVLFLDDNQPNVEAARRLGMQAEQVRGVNQSRQLLQQLGVIAPASP